jgi:protein ImuA
MVAALPWAGDDDEGPAPPSLPPVVHAGGPRELPPAVERALWRGDQLGAPVAEVISSGFEALDAELPGGGWPCGSLTEVLQAQAGAMEWRLLGPALRRAVAAEEMVVLVAPPRHPHLPGLHHAGIDEKHLIWVQAEAPSERLWCTEQLIKSGSFGALVSWIPQARPEQIRRLQVCAQGCEGPVFLCRPLAARHESSAAPLRVITALDVDWQLRVQVFKRRGPAHEGHLSLQSIPGGLEAILTPRLAHPSRLHPAHEVPADVVGSPVALVEARRHATAH